MPGADVIRLDDPEVLIRLNRSARARRFTLSVRLGEARLTAPRAAPEHETRQFLLRHTGWLREALARAPAREAVAIGATIPVDGTMRTIVDSGRRRGPCVLAAHGLMAPANATGAAVAAWLKARAQGRITPAAQRAAAMLGRPVGRISFRDTRSRWGSCTAKGDLAFSWRLAMAPPAVQDYVAIHEAAHLLEMNHGPRFWAHVARLCPDYRVHRAWLRTEGAGLHAFIFGATPPQG
jgi:predicted metal-dependent hydrolase